MSLISDASPDEIKSPYYIQNKIICEKFEQFILNKSGKIKGKFNAWSYVVYGKTPHPSKWEFKIKKATYSSGNLLLSTKYQSLQVESIWFAKNMETDCSDFLIQKPKWYNRFKKLNDFYSIKSKTPNHDLISSLTKILSPLLINQNIWKISYQNNELKIETRCENLELEIIEKLLILSQPVHSAP